jgi:hypothetical protein
MSAVMRRTVGACALAALVGLAACGSTPKSTTNFCRQLEQEMPEIAELPATPEAIDATVERYERLLEVAPLAIEADLRTVTELFQAAADMDASDPDNVQAVVDQAYYSEQSATNVAEWTLETCGVDISTGLTVAPPATTEE